jgi:hypothetical protein
MRTFSITVTIALLLVGQAAAADLCTGADCLIDPEFKPSPAGGLRPQSRVFDRKMEETKPSDPAGANAQSPAGANTQGPAGANAQVPR